LKFFSLAFFEADIQHRNEIIFQRLFRVPLMKDTKRLCMAFPDLFPASARTGMMTPISMLEEAGKDGQSRDFIRQVE